MTIQMSNENKHRGIPSFKVNKSKNIGDVVKIGFGSYKIIQTDCSGSIVCSLKNPGIQYSWIPYQGLVRL